MEGRENVKKRIEVLLDPSKPQTTSFLSAPQVHYVETCYFLASIYPELNFLREDADELSRTMMSYKGKGVQSTIDLQKALTHGETQTVEREVIMDKLKKAVKQGQEGKEKNEQ